MRIKFSGVFLVLFFAAVFALLFALKKTSTKLNLPQTKRPKEFLEFKNLHLSGYKNGKKQWQIKAGKTRVSADQRNTIFETIEEGVFYSREKGHEEIYFSATEAFYDSLLKTLKIEGDIVIRSKDGTELRVDKLEWDGMKERLTSPGKVTLSFSKGNFVGARLTADVKLEQVDISGGVSGMLLVEGKRVEEVVPQ